MDPTEGLPIPVECLLIVRTAREVIKYRLREFCPRFTLKIVQIDEARTSGLISPRMFGVNSLVHRHDLSVCHDGASFDDSKGTDLRVILNLRRLEQQAVMFD